MRRKDREVDSASAIKIISGCKVMRLAMIDSCVPYIIPLNFGYSYADGKLELYFHCAHVGRKLDIISQNPNVAFEVDGEHELIAGERACEYSYRYASVVGTGKAEVVADRADKKQCLVLLMQHQTDGQIFEFSDKDIDCVTVCRITVDEFTAKARR